MAINIREILTSDSDLIKIDKTNYNFDQIVANGGGPIGIKGQKGEIGIGNTGSKGEKGDTGAKGDIGATGADVNNWGRVDHNSTTATSILKPKKDDNDTEPTSIILGDVGYTDGESDGLVNPNAWLNIIIPDGSSVVYSNFASLLNGTTSKVNFSSSTSSDVDTYKITHDITSINKVNFEINIKNEVLINGKDALNLTSDGIININAGNNDIVLGPISSSSNAKLDVRFDNTFIRGNLTIEGNNGGYVKIPIGTTAQRPTTSSLGMIRYNSNLDVGFDSNLGSPEAFVPHPSGNYWKPLATLVDADGDTFISPDYNANDGTENVLTISVGENIGAGNFDKKIVGTIGEQDVDGFDNLNFSFKYNHIISANDDILISNDKGLRIKQNIAAVDSGNNVAQNNGASVNNRTLKDYFYRESNLQYDISTISDNEPFVSKGITIDRNSYRYTSDAIIALAFKTFTEDIEPLEKVGVIIDHTTSKMSYVKVGHMVTVWGRLDYFPYDLDTNSLQSTDHINFSGEGLEGTISQPSRRAAFAIGRPEDFPYTSALNSNRVIFPISVNLKSHDNTSVNDVNYFGVIEPGTNVFTIMGVDDKTGFISGIKTEESEDHYAKYLNIDDLALSTGDEVITLEYTFSMPTDVNSYDITPDSLSTYVEDDSLGSLDPGAGPE